MTTKVANILVTNSTWPFGSSHPFGHCGHNTFWRRAIFCGLLLFTFASNQHCTYRHILSILYLSTVHQDTSQWTFLPRCFGKSPKQSTTTTRKETWTTRWSFTFLWFTLSDSTVFSRLLIAHERLFFGLLLYGQSGKDSQQGSCLWFDEECCFLT